MLFSLILSLLLGLATALSQRWEMGRRTGGRPRAWLAVARNLGCLAACAASAFVLALPPRPAVPTPPVVRIDASATMALLELCGQVSQGVRPEERAVRELVESPPFRALLAHHRPLDSRVTADALVDVLLHLDDEEAPSLRLGRLSRITAAYRDACLRSDTIRARTVELSDAARVERAAERARSALPPQARLEATVYLVPDGYSAAYVSGNAVVLDPLQIASPALVEDLLAHELHHIGAGSLLPPPCSERDLGTALDTLANLMHEGAATCWIDGWRARPSPADHDLVVAFLRDALRHKLTPETVEARVQELLGDRRGPLYRVGNAMVARLAAARGDRWVQARLGDPVGLLRAWQQTEQNPGYQEVLSLLDGERARCPAWFNRGFPGR